MMKFHKGGLTILALIGVLLAQPARAGTEVPLRLFWSWDTDKNPQWAGEFKAVGFNAITAAAPRTPRWWDQPTAFDNLVPLLDASEKAGMGVYLQLMWSNDLTARINPHTVTLKGTAEDRLACPASPEFWRDYLTVQLEALAKKALEKPVIKGVIHDTEQYQGKETSGAITDIYCFCDHCFARFMEEQHRSMKLPPLPERGPWLEQNQLLPAYYASLEKQIETLSAALVQRVAEINPNFEMHFYIIHDSWFYRGFLRGLATSGRTVYVLDERTYNGYLPARAGEIEPVIHASNPHAVWSPGLFTSVLSPRGLFLNLRRIRQENRPYWLYNQKSPFPTDMMDELKKLEP